MTAQQLIDQLAKFPPGATVYLDYGDPRGCFTVEDVVSDQPKAGGDAYLLTAAARRLAGRA